MNAPRTRVQRRPVHGVLLLDKPLGLSSNDALQKAKWLLRAEKAGHTGTLDPLATGVLPLCFGAATKFSQLQLDADKTYEATLRLGVKTTGCSGLAYKLEYADAPNPEDVLFETNGVKVLVDPKSLPYIDGTELDFAREGLNEGFKFKNPNVKDECGCGESFNV